MIDIAISIFLISLIIAVVLFLIGQFLDRKGDRAKADKKINTLFRLAITCHIISLVSALLSLFAVPFAVIVIIRQFNF